MVFLRRVKTASGAIAVQLAEHRGGRDRVIEHLGSAHTAAELAALLAVGAKRLRPGQDVLPLKGLVDGQGAAAGAAGLAGLAAAPDAHGVVVGSVSALLVEAVQRAWAQLGFTVIADEAFFQMVLARLVEPTSVRDMPRVLGGLGVAARHRNSLMAALQRAQARGYREKIAAACFAHATRVGDLSLCLYDVTTLYFEAEHEDGLRKVGYSKERRVDPQIVVGLLVDRSGFPLQVGCFEGDTAETTTILPVIRAFQQAHQVADMVVVADAGMLSAGNLKAIDEAGLRFIVGSRSTKAPGDLESHFGWNGDAFTDGQIIDTITPRVATAAARRENDRKQRAEPVWDPAVHQRSWRAVWAYSAKRAARDGKTLTAQENRAKAVIAGEKAARTTRFVRIRNGSRSLDQAALARARRLAGLKGYVTNIPAALMPAGEVIGSYHELWHVEQSFRMSKSDLRARPLFAHTKDSIDAHLTLVMTALAIARHLQTQTGMSLRAIIHALRPLQQVTVRIAGQDILAAPQLTPDAEHILNATTH